MISVDMCGCKWASYRVYRVFHGVFHVIFPCGQSDQEMPCDWIPSVAGRTLQLASEMYSWVSWLRSEKVGRFSQVSGYIWRGFFFEKNQFEWMIGWFSDFLIFSPWNCHKIWCAPRYRQPIRPDVFGRMRLRSHMKLPRWSVPCVGVSEHRWMHLFWLETNMWKLMIFIMGWKYKMIIQYYYPKKIHLSSDQQSFNRTSARFSWPGPRRVCFGEWLDVPSSPQFPQTRSHSSVDGVASYS